MSTGDTFISYSQGLPSTHPFSLPAAFTTTSTTETAFLNSGGSQILVFVPTGTEILGSRTPFSVNANPALIREAGSRATWNAENRPFFNSSSFDSRPFRFRAWGNIAGGGTTLTSITGTIKVYCGPTATVTSDTAIISTGAVNIGNVKGAWMVQADLQWDSVSQIINGTVEYNVQNNIGTKTVITHVTSLALTSLGFGVTWTFATSSTSNTIGLSELSLESA